MKTARQDVSKDEALGSCPTLGDKQLVNPSQYALPNDTQLEKSCEGQTEHCLSSELPTASREHGLENSSLLCSYLELALCLVNMLLGEVCRRSESDTKEHAYSSKCLAFSEHNCALLT